MVAWMWEEKEVTGYGTERDPEQGVAKGGGQVRNGSRAREREKCGRAKAQAEGKSGGAETGPYVEGQEQRGRYGVRGRGE